MADKPKKKLEDRLESIFSQMPAVDAHGAETEPPDEEPQADEVPSAQPPPAQPPPAQPPPQYPAQHPTQYPQPPAPPQQQPPQPYPPPPQPYPPPPQQPPPQPGFEHTWVSVPTPVPGTYPPPDPNRPPPAPPPAENWPPAPGEMQAASELAPLDDTADSAASTLEGMAPEQIIKAKRLYNEVVMQMCAVADNLAQGTAVDATPVLRRVEKVIIELRNDDRMLLAMSHAPLAMVERAVGTIRSPEVVLYGVNAMIYGLKIGISLELAPDQLSYLGMSAVLQNVGYLGMSRDRLPTTPDAVLATLSERPGEFDRYLDLITILHFNVDTVKSIVGIAKFNDSAMTDTYNDNLEIKFATLNQICDVFVHLINCRDQGSRLSPHDAMRILSKDLKDQFHPTYVKLFLNQLTIFPVGTWVRLSTGETAKVVAVNRGYLMRPVVMVVLDKFQHFKPTPERLDLRRSVATYVTEAINDDDLSERFIDLV
ncbi:MAG: hypothetical protein QF541_05930 [Lentisphaeria bacterium]|nr:hypothetical protein [Lentisphaeria bacterium]